MLLRFFGKYLPLDFFFFHENHVTMLVTISPPVTSLHICTRVFIFLYSNGLFFLTEKPGSNNRKNLTTAGIFIYSCQFFYFFLQDFLYKQYFSGSTRKKLDKNKHKLSNGKKYAALIITRLIHVNSVYEDEETMFLFYCFSS